MATPHVAAAAAMVIANGNATTPNEVRNLLESTADDLGADGRDNAYGHGLLNLATALGSTPPPPPPPPEPEANQPPVADAGDDQTVSDDDNNGSETVTLDGSKTSDPDGNIVSHEWYEGTTHLGSGDTLEKTFPVGSHGVELRVLDSEGASSSDSVVITVEAYVPPPPPPVNSILFEDGFESGIGNWTQDNQGDWKSSRRESRAGRRAAEVDGNANNALLISPNLSSGASTQVSFSWLIERGFDNGEYLAMDISTDYGATWTEHRRLRGNTDTEDVWHDELITLGTVNQVQIRFRAKVSSATEDSYVDEVVIEVI